MAKPFTRQWVLIPNQLFRRWRLALYKTKVIEIVSRCSRWENDLSSRYGTKMFYSYNDLFVSYRPVRFRDTKAIMFHSLEAENPSEGTWKKFWHSVLDLQPEVLAMGFEYIIIDCILEPYFEKHIAKTWELVKPYELPDASTFVSTYCWKLRSHHA